MSRMLSKLLLVWMAVASMGARAYGSSLAYITVGGSEQQVSGAWDTGTATISFNGFVETVQYGQFSTPASIASAFAAMFSRDYLASGLCANALGATITFKLKGNATFGKLNIDGTGTSFQYASSGFLAQTASVVDVGTVGLFMKNPSSSSSDWIIASSTNYGAGATPTTIAQGLESGIKAGSFVNISANGDDLYLESKQVGSGTNYSYSIQTTSYDSAHFSQPSFANPAITGTLSGGANAGTSTGQTVYSYSATYDGVGNVMTYNDSANGNWDMTGGYDSLNRLTGAHATSGTYTGDYFCWNYDAFGNRKQQTIASGAGFSNAAGATCQVGSGGTLLSNNWANYTTDGQSSSADNGKNRLTGTPLGTYSSTPVIGYYSYDAAGNLTSDAHNQYLYDGEGRVCAVLNDYGTMIGYIYDADGTRVAKGSLEHFTCDLNPTDTYNPSTKQGYNGFHTQSDYILGPGGEQMTEMAMDTDGSMYVAHNNVWAGGKLLATYDADGALHFYLTDPLGSRRVMTNYAGVVEQNCQNLPFGDGENCGPTPTEHLFTGKERDAESGNDYFKYRYYASSMGRWLSPDPSGLTHADLENPQSLNLYNYVGNRPLTLTDLDGLCWKGFQWACDLGNAIKNVAIEAKNKIGYGEWTTNTKQAIIHKLDRDEAKHRRNSYRKETQSVPDPDDDRPGLTAMVKGVARNTAGFPDVCSGGVFFVKGGEVSVGAARGEGGVITEIDSKDGTSVGGLAEGSGGEGATAGGGAIVGTGGVEAFGFVGAEADIGVGEAGAGVVGFSSGGVGVYAQGGAFGRFNEAGAYLNVSTMGGCAQHK